MLIPAVHPAPLRCPACLASSFRRSPTICFWPFCSEFSRAAAAGAFCWPMGDTGWPIRTSEYILDTRSVPVRDLYSFSKAGQP